MKKVIEPQEIIRWLFGQVSNSRVQDSIRDSRRNIRLASIAAALLALSANGCASKKETPQQQFTDALTRGNAAQASYIWNNMSAQNRASFSRGEGIKPQVDPGAIAAQIVQHQAEQKGDDSGNDPPPTVDIPGE
jgi:hypothetical protein